MRHVPPVARIWLLAAIACHCQTAPPEQPHQRHIAGDLRVGIVDAVSSLPDLNLSSAIGRFYARTDEVRLELLMASPVDLTQRLISGDLHIGIAPFRNRITELSYTELCVEDYSLYCGRAHPLFHLSSDKITADVLAAYPVCQRTYDLSLTAD